jgi:glycosyltransferase involved in cell wall biosynthesis
VIPNTSDIELFSGHEDGARRFREAQEWLLDRPLVVYTGTLGAVNGVGYLVRLAASVRALDPEVRFLVVGSGKEWDQVKRLAADLGVLNATLRMCPEVPKADIPVILAAATMATSVCRPVPGLRHNSASKFFDALAAGRPIAINYEGWQADLLRTTGAGLVLDPNDVETSAGSLVTALHDRDWLVRAGDAARRLAIDQFSSDVLFDRFEAVLLSAVSGQRPRRGRRTVLIRGGTMGGAA